MAANIGTGNLRRGYICGVPKNDCLGSAATGMSASLAGRYKSHSTQREAFRCYVKWRERQGYVRVGPHELQHKDGGPVEMLGKVSHFGMELRRGKAGNRLMPSKRHGGGIT